jgi:hypothetical protein
MLIKNLQLWDQISSQKFTNLQLYKCIIATLSHVCNYKVQFCNCNNYISVLDIQLWMMHCLLIYYRDHYACQNYWLQNCIFTCICLSCMLNPNNLVQIYRSFAITGNYGRRSFSKYGISYYTFIRLM